MLEICRFMEAGVDFVGRWGDAKPLDPPDVEQE
jgi:hypothetical protein